MGSIYVLGRCMICELCDRPIPEGKSTEHHLVPCCEGGRKGVKSHMHEICHKQVHALFTERELAMVYNTIGKLREQKDVMRFVNWIQDKPNDFDIRIKVSRRKRG